MDSKQAIPGILNVLSAKSKALDAGIKFINKEGQIVEYKGFNFYGKPKDSEKIKFVLAAYNGGQGKI